MRTGARHEREVHAPKGASVGLAAPFDLAGPAAPGVPWVRAVRKPERPGLGHRARPDRPSRTARRASADDRVLHAERLGGHAVVSTARPRTGWSPAPRAARTHAPGPCIGQGGFDGLPHVRDREQPRQPQVVVRDAVQCTPIRWSASMSARICTCHCSGTASSPPRIRRSSSSGARPDRTWSAKGLGDGTPSRHSAAQITSPPARRPAPRCACP